MSLLMVGAAVIFFSIFAFWKANAIVFIICAGASLMTGLLWFDIYTNNAGLSISLVFIAYSFLCLGLAFRCIFWREDVLE